MVVFNRFIIIQRIVDAVYGGIDSIIVSSVLGVSLVVFLINYLTIKASVMQLLDEVMPGLRPAIGGIVYDGIGNIFSFGADRIVQVCSGVLEYDSSFSVLMQAGWKKE